jgi:hypothetical protein
VQELGTEQGALNVVDDDGDGERDGERRGENENQGMKRRRGE